MDPLIIVFVACVLLLAFWPIYDRVQNRKRAKTQPLAIPYNPEKPAVWECPVCSKAHRTANGGKSKSGCPFAAASPFAGVYKDQQIRHSVTNLGGHFEYNYWVWEYGDKIYLTGESYDSHGVQSQENGDIYVSAYYTACFCNKEEWRPDAKTWGEVDRAIAKLNDRILNSLYWSGESHDYIVGLNRILGAGVTENPSCAKTGYVIWRGDQDIYITGVRSDASADDFNYDKISRGVSIRKFCKPYTRRLCHDIDELRKMSQDEIDSQAYGAYMDGAK